MGERQQPPSQGTSTENLEIEITDCKLADYYDWEGIVRELSS